ncbi:MAG: N-acetylneuraminate synthase [Gemmatales bacterium]|nr:N-acetylneuraminate synthase [Gemmatales bacterium]MDW7995509.1 N-acetylneuraminate synthase [Gemmatales bacterium]
MEKTINIAGRLIGAGYPCFIIAEAGVNHNGDLELAKRLVEVAAQAGADAVKFQTFRTEQLVSHEAPLAKYQESNLAKVRTQAQMLKKLELSDSEFRILADYARAQGLIFLSTAFDTASADLLESIGVPAYKVPSGELTNTEFLQYLAKRMKPMIISTGMATLAEVEAAVEAIEACGNDKYALLHCVSNYPAQAEEVNLRAMLTLKTAFQAPIGYSDHTIGLIIPIAAVALGACILEKHFTLDRTLPGPDHKASATPEELKQLIDSVRQVERAMGDGRKRPVPSEQDTMRAARKSLVAACDISAGTRLETEHIALRRPGTGLPPSAKPFLLGRRAKRFIAAGTPLTLDMVA